MIPGMISIPIEQYNSLQEESLFLNCLRNAGVDNWDWYDEAVKEFNRINEEGE